jgi:3-dehydroquinate dehydratase
LVSRAVAADAAAMTQTTAGAGVLGYQFAVQYLANRVGDVT